MNPTKKTIFTLLSSIILLVKAEGLDYEWEVKGSIHPELAEVIKTDAPIASKDHVSGLNVLSQLADNQVDLWLQELHSRAFFNAKVSWVFSSQNPPVVTFYVDPGVVYPLNSVNVIWQDEPLFDIFPEDLGLRLHDPALPSAIYDAEESFLHLMALKGYPLAKIIERQVIADQEARSILLVLYVEGGQQLSFGETRLVGNTSVHDSLIWQKIAWKEGKTFNPEKIERSQEELEATGLFSSVVIKEGDEPDAQGRIPLEVRLTEAKHRTVSGGIGYSTQQGIGLSGEWQHRNFRGMGERLDVQAKCWTEVQNGQIQYMIPGFGHSNQDLRFLIEAEHEKTKGYTETSFSLSSFLDKQINNSTFLSYGISYKQLKTTRSDNNGTFNLLKLPVLLKWTNADDALDPTTGYSLTFRSAPSFQIGSKSFGYWFNSFVGTSYIPLDEAETIVFASKLTAGTILGASRREIPPSERLYSGTENTLRGYRFMSVSPLDNKHKPIGGKSMLILSNELRFRCTEKIGLAAFYEVGNVYANPFPDVTDKQLQSIGAGIRYNTPIGQLRFDAAVPLNPRRHVDPPCQFYMSIGQAF